MTFCAKEASLALAMQTKAVVQCGQSLTVLLNDNLAVLPALLQAGQRV
jgi:hypothetical protein